MAFQDLSEFFDPRLPLTVRGKTYMIPDASAADGLRLRQLIALNALDGVTEEREALRLLGAEWVVEEDTAPLFDAETGKQALDDDGNYLTKQIQVGHWEGGLFQEMSDDGLTIDEIVHCGITALVRTAQGMEAAEKHWTLGLQAKAEKLGNPVPPKQGANRATRRTASKPAKKAAAKKAPAKKSSSRRSTAASTTRAPAPTDPTT